METSFNWPKEDTQQQIEAISNIPPFHTMKDRNNRVSLNDGGHGVKVSTLHDPIV
jgi:hypothetical protein